jgi:DNA repair exonuclease SbcCD ATPase subunit
MEVDVAPNSKKRVAEVPLEEIPFAKRTKFKELFPSVFSSAKEMDMNTLKIQNRELVVKLTERTKTLETTSLELAKSDASQATLSRNISQFAIFMHQVVEEIQSIIGSISSDASMEEGNLDLLKAFHAVVVAESFEKANLAPVREALLKLVKRVSTVMNVQQASRDGTSQASESGSLGAAQVSESSLEKEKSGKPENWRELRRKALEMEMLAGEQEEELKRVREYHEDVMERLRRMLNHVTRLELEMEKMQEKHEEETRRLIASQSPSVSIPKMATPGPDGPTTEGDSHVEGEQNGVSVEAYQALIARNEELGRELEDMKALSTSRLTEITGLREEKIDLLRKSTISMSAPTSSSENGVGASEVENRMLKEELKAKVEKIERLLKEVSDLKSAHAEAKRKLLETTKAQVEDSRAKLERMTGKFKTMESEREKMAHELVEARQLREAKLDHLPHVAAIQRSLAETQSKLEASEKKVTEHETLLAALTGDSASLEARLKKALEDVAFLKKELLQPNWMAAENEEKKNAIISAASELARLTEALASAKENEDALAAALSDLTDDNTKLAAEVDERDRKLADLVRERVNASSLATSSKKMKQIEAVLANGEKTRGGTIEKMLLAEKRVSAALKEELERTKTEVEQLKKMTLEYENVTAQNAIAMEILRKRSVALETQLKDQESTVNDAKVTMETERAKAARVEEEVAMLKRRESSLLLRASSSDAVALDASLGDLADKDAKTADLFRQIFNCALCDRSRQVNVAITKCGHAFCKVCIENKCMKSRNRKCPKCKVAFGASDTLNLFFG